MTLTAPHPGALDPAPGRWLYDLATLAGAGVHVDAEQAQLLDPDTGIRDVVVPFALADPIFDYDGMREDHELPRMWTHDKFGRKSTVVIPAVGRVDWEQYTAAFDDDRLREWWRFPSVPVRVIIPDAHDECEEVARCTRVWNCWPLPDTDADSTAAEINVAFMNESERLYSCDWHNAAAVYARLHNGRLAACELAGDPAGHTHSSMECLNGNWAAEQMRVALFVDEQVGWWRPPALEAVFTDVDANDIWTRLVTSSQRNSAACLDVVPLWDTTELALSESRFCPWALS